MSLDKAIEHGKEKRKPYRGAKAVDATCRNHGSDKWCETNRRHKMRDKLDSVSIEDDLFPELTAEEKAANKAEAKRRMGMSIDKAIETLSDELSHIQHHLTEKGKDPEFYAELGQLATAMELGIAALKEKRSEVDHFRDATKMVYPCADCRWSPPSSGDGKPCCACEPDIPGLNCYERKETTENDQRI